MIYLIWESLVTKIGTLKTAEKLPRFSCRESRMCMKSNVLIVYYIEYL